MSNLQTLEFSECVIDSPEFRDKLVWHEKDIDVSYKTLKDIYSAMKNVYRTVEECSKAFNEFGNLLKTYKSEEEKKLFDVAETEDEKLVNAALTLYSETIESIEEMRTEHILGPTKDLIFNDLQDLKENCLAKCKGEIKDFKKSTNNYYQKLEKYVSIKNKQDGDYINSDNEMQKERKDYVSKAMDHVMTIQHTQEQKTFRLVRTLSLFIQMLNTYHHQAWDHFCDQKKKIDEITCALSRTEENYQSIAVKTNKLKEDYLSIPIEHIQKTNQSENVKREGYLFMLAKKNVMADYWTRNFSVYEKSSKRLIVTPINQPGSTGKEQQSEEMFIESCERRKSTSTDRRFCFDIRIVNKKSPITLQAISKEDLNLWMSIMDGKEPIYAKPRGVSIITEIETILNSKGIRFMEMCIEEIELKGLDQVGLYRTPGRAGQTEKIMRNISFELRTNSKNDVISSRDLQLLDINTLCSLVKAYLKYLKDPLATFQLYDDFIKAGKIADPQLKYTAVYRVIQELPNDHKELFAILMHHLKRVAQYQDQNKMSAPNLGVCFSPTIFRPEESTASLKAIRDSKFAGDVISFVIERCDVIFPGIRPLKSNIKREATDGKSNVNSTDCFRPRPKLSSKSVFIPKSFTNNELNEKFKKDQIVDVTKSGDKNIRRTSGEQKPIPLTNTRYSLHRQKTPPATSPKPDISKIRYSQQIHNTTTTTTTTPTTLNKIRSSKSIDLHKSGDNHFKNNQYRRQWLVGGNN